MSSTENGNSLTNSTNVKQHSWFKTALWFCVVAIVFFWIGYSGLLQAIGKSSSYLFNLYVQAEEEKLRASGYVNDQGEPEYVVSVLEDNIIHGQQQLSSLPGVKAVRDTLFDGWFVVSLEAGSRSAIDTVKNAPFVEFALPNRGVWFCH